MSTLVAEVMNDLFCSHRREVSQQRLHFHRSHVCSGDESADLVVGK